MVRLTVGDQAVPYRLSLSSMGIVVDGDSVECMVLAVERIALNRTLDHSETEAGVVVVHLPAEDSATSPGLVQSYRLSGFRLRPMGGSA